MNARRRSFALGRGPRASTVHGRSTPLRCRAGQVGPRSRHTHGEMVRAARITHERTQISPVFRLFQDVGSRLDEACS
jgi:hypothetical protein